MRRIFGLLIILMIIIFTYGCANQSIKPDNEQSIEVSSDSVIGFGDEQAEDAFEKGGTIQQVTKPVRLSNGTLVYKVDSILTVGIVSRVEARVIKGTNQVTTERLVTLTTHTNTGVIKTEIIKVGDIMEMELISDQENVFDITQIIGGDQPVDDSDITEWAWGITALKTGDYNLILRAKIKGNTRHKIVFDKQVFVKNKPKILYNMVINIPENMVKYVDNTIKIELFERRGDTYFFEWGGNGKVELEFIGLNPGEVIEITKDDDTDYTINDNKTLFNYSWIIKPKKLDLNRDSLHYVIKIIGDYEEIIITNRIVKLDKNWKGGFNEFIDNTVERWYWIFTTLLIPIYLWIRKKPTPKT